MWIVAMALLALTVAQPFDQYSGRWTAKYQGTTYIQLVLGSTSVGAPQGAMSIGESIHVDAQGNVDGVTEAPSPLMRMLDVNWNGRVLSFSIKHGDDIHRFELRLIDASTGELTPVIPEEQRQELANDGIPLPKPFRVTKAP